LAQRDDADPLAATAVTRNARVMLDHDADPTHRALARTQLRDLADDWLVERRRAVEEVAEVTWADRDPFHWALEFPEVGAHGGFDAVIGNPPFQGGKKISGELGTGYRDCLVAWVAHGGRGSADLVAYFYLRAVGLLRADGGIGLIATNTVAQGDTREVGLERLVAQGLTIYRAIASEPWPGGANLETATVWARRGKWSGTTTLDRGQAAGITSSLAVRSRVHGTPHRLLRNRDQAFIGSLVLGMGFVLSADEAAAMRATDPRCAEVVRPYLTGEDLNQRPDGSPSRWVIDFRDWPEEQARTYSEPFARVAEFVRPQRAKLNRETYRRRWWQFAERVQGLYGAIAALDRCIVIARVSKTVQPMIVPTGIIFNEKIVAFAYDDYGHLGLLSSGFHWWWAVTHSSTLRTDTQYTPTDCFGTFVQPEPTCAVAELGERLDSHRSGLMLGNRHGLTKTYNRVHDADERADDIVRLRELHVELDYAVRDAYGWTDLDLRHDFHDTRAGTRFTFAPRARQEVLDRLLELNHERYADEVRRGLHGKAKSAGKRRPVAEGAMTLGFDGV
ncbi:MAG TPA: type IIL restriction-modification enzyme MmeI, partial [Jatrophihabitantaceae bacterium]|nr:type IIL restriction-modification enzyme MmeI [Jatrophihabitantaceae bacterium]